MKSIAMLSPTHVSLSYQPVKASPLPEVETTTPLPPTPADSIHLNKVASPHTTLRSGVKYEIPVYQFIGNQDLLKGYQKLLPLLREEFISNMSKLRELHPSEDYQKDISLAILMETPKMPPSLENIVQYLEKELASTSSTLFHSIKEEAQEKKESIEIHNYVEKVFSEILQSCHSVTLSRDEKSVMVNIAWEAKTPSYKKEAQKIIPTWENVSSELFKEVATELGLTLTEVKTEGTPLIEWVKKRFGF
ncbi:MAG: hypothetical protein H2174_10820 [Vampirovibrio sp.]|nr:hypothetical protein [Vampirovibrio sp.]